MRRYPCLRPARRANVAAQACVRPVIGNDHPRPVAVSPGWTFVQATTDSAPERAKVCRKVDIRRLMQRETYRPAVYPALSPPPPAITERVAVSSAVLDFYQ